MKLKTSCFNRTIFKKNITHYWPLWGLHLLFLMLMQPVLLHLETNSQWYLENQNDPGTVMSVLDEILRGMMEPFSIFIAAVVMALAVFCYLYTAKNANMMHALPVNRLELFVTNYLSGLSFLLIPEAIAFLAMVLVCLGNEITSIQYLFLGFLCQVSLGFFAYSLAVFVAMFTGQILATPVYYVAVNYLYVGCMYIVTRVIELMGYGISSAWNPGKSCILSPLYYLENNLWSRYVYGENAESVKGLEIHGMYLVGIYAAVGVVLVVAAYQLYKRRQLETAGDWISIGIVKPVFRWGVALCGGVLLAVGFTELLRMNSTINVYACLLISVIVTGFVCFFAAEMLLEKSFRVWRKKRIFEWAGFTVVAVVFITLFRVDAFGVERHIPKAEEIEAAFVYMDFPMHLEEDELAELLEVHRTAIEHKSEYQEIEREGKGYYYTTFRYYLKDGDVFERRYPIAVTEAYLKDETTPARKLLAWESSPEKLKEDILGPGFEHNEYMSGMIDLYHEELGSKMYAFNREEIDAIVAALKKDIEAGNFNKYKLWSAYGGETDSYYNNICLDFYNADGYSDSWDYYNDYRYYKKTRNGRADREHVMSRSVGISFGPECVNTVAALEELGIVDDGWKLATYEEYEAYMNYEK